MIGFSKYEFNNKLLGGVTLLRVISGVTWTQPYLYIYIYIYMKKIKKIASNASNACQLWIICNYN